MPPAEAQVDDLFMRRAMALAIRGRGAVEPNPMVGCVIVKEGRVIGEGHHEKYGGPHAEPNALVACTESPAGATVYVTLEPCCHTDKKTPPCVPRLIEARVGRVVIGCLDPNPQVGGKGIEQLRQAGIDVSVSALEVEAKQLIAPFFKQVDQGLPYVTLKWAQSSNGRVAGPGGKTIWITNAKASHVVHQLRARCDAILVGINTALADDPLLTARAVQTQRPLLRAVLDSHLRLPATSRLAKTAGLGPVVVFCSSTAYLETRRQQVRELQDQGVRVIPLGSVSGEVLDDATIRLSLTEMLHEIGGTHLLVEPGPTLAQSFLRQGLTDRVWIFRSPNSIDEAGALVAPEMDYPASGAREIEGDKLTEYLNPSSAAFFSLQTSPDFRMLLDG